MKVSWLSGMETKLAHNQKPAAPSDDTAPTAAIHLSVTLIVSPSAQARPGGIGIGF
jgi:hypothetical protein